MSTNITTFLREHRANLHTLYENGHSPYSLFLNMRKTIELNMDITVLYIQRKPLFLARNLGETAYMHT